MKHPAAPHDPAAVLAAGRQVLDAILLPAGFTYVAGESGPSCGGRFAQAAYVAGERRIDLSVRWQLGLVTYHFGDASLPHDEFMRAALGGRQGNAFPGFERDPREAFDFLAQDLQGPARPFVQGDKARFLELVAWVSANPRRHGFGAIGALDTRKEDDGRGSGRA